MTVRTKSGLSFELVTSKDVRIRKIDSLLAKL
jgi:hypothetical protein